MKWQWQFRIWRVWWMICWMWPVLPVEKFDFAPNAAIWRLVVRQTTEDYRPTLVEAGSDG